MKKYTFQIFETHTRKYMNESIKPDFYWNFLDHWKILDENLEIKRKKN